MKKIVIALVTITQVFTTFPSENVAFRDGTFLDADIYLAKGFEPDKNGVIIDDYGRPVEYQVGNRVNGVLTDVINVPASDFSLYMKRIRPSQWRGVPTMAPCVNTLMDVSEYEEIEMIAAKVHARTPHVCGHTPFLLHELP